MQKENILQVEEMIELELWLQQNKNNSLTLSEWITLFARFPKEKRNYLIMAKLLPQKEIEEAIEYYDGNRFPVMVDEIGFIYDLANKYSVDRTMIIERFKQVRMIKNHQKNKIKTKKRKKQQK